MPVVSVVIPSRNERFLGKTVKDLLEKARGEIEIIVILDGYWTEPNELPEDDRLHIIHRGKSHGMRNGIASAVAIAKGKYIMKIDAHCMLDEGYDVKLVADCEKNWVVVPKRKRLDPEAWVFTEDGRPDIDYMYLTYPYLELADGRKRGLHGDLWKELNNKDPLPEEHIVDLMSAQGSCWFMHKDYFYELELCNEEQYGPFWNEFLEIGLNCWLSGGRVVRNKATWYAHLHKGKKYGRGYPVPKGTFHPNPDPFLGWMEMGTMFHKQIYPIEWLIAKFTDTYGPVPGWPEEYQKYEV
jgi:glycosyltransferase involved in cell wall biosynthesis